MTRVLSGSNCRGLANPNYMQSHTRWIHCQQPTIPDRPLRPQPPAATVMCHAVPARLRGGWRCTPAGHRRLIAYLPSPSRNSASQQNRTSSTPSASPFHCPTIRRPQFHSALLILARPLRWTAAASSPRSSWSRCAFTWPPTPARRSPRRSASSTSSTSPPRSAFPPPPSLSQISRESLLFYLPRLRASPARSTAFLNPEFLCGYVRCRSSALTRRSSWSISRRARSPKVRPFPPSFGLNFGSPDRYSEIFDSHV